MTQLETVEANELSVVENQYELLIEAVMDVHFAAKKAARAEAALKE